MAARIEPVRIGEGLGFDELMAKYEEAKRMEKKYKDDATIILNQIFELVAYDREVGTEKFESDQYLLQLSVTKDYKVDTQKAVNVLMNNGYSAMDMFSMFKVELKCQSEFKKLPDEVKALFEGAIEVKNSSPKVGVQKLSF